MIRSGQPKCVCAPKCKAKNQRPKRNNRHATAQSKSPSHQEQHRRSGDLSNRTLILNQSGHYQSTQIDADTSHDVQIFHSDNLNNQSNMKSDKIISIIAPIHPSNLSSSHRRKETRQPHNATTHNGRSRVMKSRKSSRRLLAAANNNNSSRATHRSNGSKKHPYGNSSLFDNNTVNVNHRRQTSVPEQFKSKFYGHDIPYPPIDLPVS